MTIRRAGFLRHPLRQEGCCDNGNPAADVEEPKPRTGWPSRAVVLSVGARSHDAVAGRGTETRRGAGGGAQTQREDGSWGQGGGRETDG